MPASPWGPARAGDATVTLTPRDTLDALRLAVRMPPWRLAQRSGWCGLIFAIVAATATGRTSEPDLAATLAAAAAGLALPLFMRLVLLHIVLPVQCRRLHRRMPDIGLEHRLTWDSEGLTVSSVKGVQRLPWTGFYGRRQDARTLLVYVADAAQQTVAGVRFIPRRVLTAEQQASLGKLAEAVPVR